MAPDSKPVKRRDSQREHRAEADSEEVPRRQPAEADDAAGRIADRGQVEDDHRYALENEEYREHHGIEVHLQHTQETDDRPGGQCPHPPGQVDVELTQHEIAEDRTEESVQSNLDGVVGGERDERRGDAAGPAEPVGDVRVERTGVGYVPAHRPVADSEDSEHDREKQVRQGGTGIAADGVHGRDAATEDGQRRRRRHREEDEVSCPQSTAAQAGVEGGGIG